MGVRRDENGVAHIVALSGGKDSTAMAVALSENEPRPYIYVCTPTGDELPDMIAHWAKLEVLLGAELIRVRAKQDLNGLIEFFGALPNHRQRWCTRMLKILPYLAFVKTLLADGPVVSYVGLRADEESRSGADFQTDGVTTEFPMRGWGWGISEVKDFLRERNIVIPARTDCARCYDQRLYEWRNLYMNHPDIYAEAERQEETYGHTFRSPSRDTWPAPLALLRVEFDKGRIPRGTPKDEEQTRCRACRM